MKFIDFQNMIVEESFDLNVEIDKDQMSEQSQEEIKTN